MPDISVVALLTPRGGKYIRPYEVRVDGTGRGRFDDIRDAVSSAQIAKRACLGSVVSVENNSTGQMVIEING